MNSGGPNPNPSYVPKLQGLKIDVEGLAALDACTLKQNPLDAQIAGTHYKTLTIQPVEYIHANNIPFIEGNVIKYVTRWRNKGGIKDLEKAKHFIELLIELENKNVKCDPNLQSA